MNVIGSYLPWFEVFFRLLNYIADIIKCCTVDTELRGVELLLDRLQSVDVSQPHCHVDVTLPTSGLVCVCVCVFVSRLSKLDPTSTLLVLSAHLQELISIKSLILTI